jgi:hypothetical protein
MVDRLLQLRFFGRVDGFEVLLSMWDHKEIRGNHLVVKEVRLNATNLMSCIRLGHLISKGVYQVIGHWFHKVYEKVVIDSIHRVLSDLLEHRLIPLVDKIDSRDVTDLFALLVQTEMQSDIAIAKSANLHNCGNNVLRCLIIN